MRKSFADWKGPENRIICPRVPFRSDMSRDERLTAYKQERSLLVTGRIYTYYDPYALASTGGPTNFFDLEPEARKAADARIEALIQEYKQAHGITDK